MATLPMSPWCGLRSDERARTPRLDWVDEGRKEKLQMELLIGFDRHFIKTKCAHQRVGESLVSESPPARIPLIVHSAVVYRGTIQVGKNLLLT